MPASKQSPATIFPSIFHEIFETYRNVERIVSNHMPTIDSTVNILHFAFPLISPIYFCYMHFMQIVINGTSPLTYAVDIIK